MTYTTKTAEFGSITFSAPAATDTYRGRVWIDGPSFKERRQICYGGDFSGSTVQSSAQELKADAQQWLRDRRVWMRKEGIAV
jgi:hypothetical protein